MVDIGHAGHDAAAVAAHAAGLADEDAARGAAMSVACTECALLAADLRALAAATAGLAATPARRPPGRDFRLSADDAARLAPGSLLDRLLGRRAIAARSAPTGRALQVFGGALMTLGLAGFALAGGLPGPSRDGTAGGAYQTTTEAASPGPGAAGSLAPHLPAPTAATILVAPSPKSADGLDRVAEDAADGAPIRTASGLGAIAGIAMMLIGRRRTRDAV